ncbi:LodA/GoxA family CTQ-dependent oxidase [Pseudomonas palmensis]|uniref:LodA/GoxA family CTQ-dependent oxidase n=1 Tax=Pseudomonas palmensis TaxID=2815362 RepID=UPI001AE19BB2|nr:LodA/GoxA family CTQ-dependent oxidase [Pseudomonas palmensis]
MISPASIKSIRVHPGLGVARVGNADGDEEYVLAAQVPGALASSADGQFRDARGQVRRQAVRFRLYAELHDGTVQELSLDDGVQIEWTVEVANLKAGWYAFENAMDLPGQYAIAEKRRNPHVTGAQRQALDIRPGPRTISGRRQQGKPFHFDTGTFHGKPVYLGELRTDEAGRLIALGGHGHSAPRVDKTPPTTFANNDDWHDDVSDGPVYARVTFNNGQRLDAEPGYLVVTPPNYAPGLFGVVTMEEVVRDLFVRQGQLPAEPGCSFTRDIWPIFERMTHMQWTNQGLFMLSGHGSPLDTQNPDVVARLADPGEASADFRRKAFALFRDPASTAEFAPALLPLYGDYYGDYDLDPQPPSAVGLAVTPLMYQALSQWAQGEFVADWQGAPVPEDFDTLEPRAQAQALDRAGLHECLGGPFHPGIELTWFMRVPSVWRSPYRLAVLPQGQAVRQDFGDELTPQVCLAPQGPLDGVGPGSLTRALGVPWQTDEASCLSDAEYEPSTYLSFPSYWGARVPNQVLSSEAWERVGARRTTPAQQLKHFSYREDWLRDLKGSYFTRINLMVSHWWELGILLAHDATPEATALGLPARAWIESGRPERVTGSNAKLDLLAVIEALDSPPPLLGETELEPPRQKVPPRRRLRRDEI